MGKLTYQLALDKLSVIHALLPAGYKESRSLEEEANSAIATQAQIESDSKAAEAKAEQEEKAKLTVATCEKLINPKITIDEMSQCLQSVISQDPYNNDVVRLTAAAEKIEKDRIQKEAEAKNLTEKINELSQLFKEAESVHAEGFAFKAIRKYKMVIRICPTLKNLKLLRLSARFLLRKKFVKNLKPVFRKLILILKIVI
jgi:hypothetical protein